MDDVLEQVRRWEDSGGTWRVLVHTPERLELELLTCDGGEVMQQLSSVPPAPDLEAHLAGRDASTP